jgi:RNA polymerase sigma-70 factor (ECF subfamily)
MAIYESFDDFYLFDLIKRGNEQAFTELYNRYWQKLYFLAHKHLKSSPVSEEIVQEVFLTIWKKRESLLIDSVQVYLAAMTRYAVYANMSRQKKQSEKTGQEQFRPVDPWVS